MTRNCTRWFAPCLMVVALATLGVITAPRSAGAVDGDVRAGVYPDADAVALGGGILTRVGNTGNWYFNPNVELAIGDRRDMLFMSGDFHYDFAQDGNASFWMGGGPAVFVVDRQVGNTDTDVGVNVLTGVGVRRGEVRPFAQLRGTVADNSQIAIAGGIRF